MYANFDGKNTITMHREFTEQLTPSTFTTFTMSRISSNANAHTDKLPKLPSYHTSEWKLISQGAEARVWLIPSLMTVTCVTGTANPTQTFSICKERFPKSYRHPTLDAQITRSRLKAEVRCLTRCRRSGLLCPDILAVDVQQSCLFMKYLSGCPVRQFFMSFENKNWVHVDSSSGPITKRPRNGNECPNNIGESCQTRIDEAAMKVAYEMGLMVAQMHNVNVIHGDLTTSNMMLTNADIRDDKSVNIKEDKIAEWKPKLALIDFGLSGLKAKDSNEEKAVDLYVLERSFISTHPGSKILVEEFHRAYKGASKTSDAVLQRLFAVRLRGRKRECFG